MKRNTVERPIKTEMTQAQNEKEWASSVGLCPKHNPQHPHHVKVNPPGQRAGMQGCTPLLPLGWKRKARDLSQPLLSTRLADRQLDRFSGPFRKITFFSVCAYYDQVL